MQGASATESLLAKSGNPDLRVLVVWEPILLTDWQPPTSFALAQLHETYVAQFWDHNHLVAHEIARELNANPSGPQPQCCGLNKTLWDFAAIYPKGAIWNSVAPQAVFANGPVAYVQEGLSGKIAALRNQNKQGN